MKKAFLLAICIMLNGCVSTVVDAASTVVEGAYDITTGVVGAGYDLVAGGDDEPEQQPTTQQQPPQTTDQWDYNPSTPYENPRYQQHYQQTQQAYQPIPQNHAIQGTWQQPIIAQPQTHQQPYLAIPTQNGIMYYQPVNPGQPQPSMEFDNDDDDDDELPKFQSYY